MFHSTISGLSHRASSELLGDLEPTTTSTPGSYPLRSLPEHSTSTPAMASPSELPQSPSDKLPLHEESTQVDDNTQEDVKGFRGPATIGGAVTSNDNRPRTAGRDRGQSITSRMEGSQPPRLDYDYDNDDIASQAGMATRRPSRQQIMRYGPPPSEAGDYGYDRPYWPRPPYEYGVPVRPPPQHPGMGGDYWGEDPAYYNRPYNRRMTSLRESDEYRSQAGSAGGRGPPGPPRRRYTPYDDEPSEYDHDDDERPLRNRARRYQYSEKSSKSPPPEVIMRLPFTEWMNRSAKARKCANSLRKMS